MPKISLAVCLRGERDFLARLLENTKGCYDDLVVVHDGPEERKNNQPKREAGKDKEKGWNSPEELSLAAPDAPPKAIARDYAQFAPGSPLPTGYRLVGGPTVPGSVHELVDGYGGRFYEGPRCFQQEPHWPFAWWAAKNDWILRLDADEYPSDSLIKWLLNFNSIDCDESGYTAIWPLWTGKKEIWSTGKPARLFLFNRKLVRFIGMVERSPEFIKNRFQSLPLLIHHRPKRKSYGIFNLLGRKQAYRWRKVIARSLFLEPFDLPRWNYSENKWDSFWNEVRDHPLQTAIFRGVYFPIYQFLKQIRSGCEFAPDAILGTCIHQLMMALSFWITKNLFGCNCLKPHRK